MLLAAVTATATLSLAASPPAPAQPLAPRYNASLFPIEWRAVNILHLTDVHSFIAGNRHESIDSDYGDLLSFIGHMHDLAGARGVDLFVVNTGDIVDGTGMSDATPVAGEFLTPILQLIPYDAMTIGNHELYEDATVDNLARPGGFLEHFGDKCITSNQLYNDSREPLSTRFSVIEGRNGARLLTFGFLYDFRDYCPKCFVAEVESVVQEQWFTDAVAQCVPSHTCRLCSCVIVYSLLLLAQARGGCGRHLDTCPHGV